jgi:FixJ family two-component response regulator
MSSDRPHLSVIDDDASVRESLPGLLIELGFRVSTFSSAEAFLASERVSDTGCLIVDVSMPGMNGPDLQRELRRRGRAVPIVYMTALWSDALRSRLVDQGAVDCLFKPFSEAVLLGALASALRGPRPSP